MDEDSTKQLLKDPATGDTSINTKVGDVATLEEIADCEERGEQMSLPCEERVQMSLAVRMAKTVAMASIYVALGFNSGVKGPTLLDLANLFCNGDVEKLSRAVSFGALGTLTGSFLGALIGDRFRAKADILLFVTALLNGFTCAAAPWMPNVELLGLAFFIMGLNHGTFNVACCSISIAIWGKKASSPIHALHMSYSLGYTLAQPISGLFVASAYSNTTQTSTALLELFTPAPDAALSGFLSGGSGFKAAESNDLLGNNGTHVYIPYGIFGAYQVLLSFSFLVFFVSGSTYTSTTIRERKSFKQLVSPSSCSGGRGSYGVYMLISLFFLYIGIVSREATLGLYLCTVGTIVFHMSGFTASLLGLAYNVCVLIGRLLGVAIALCVRIQIMVAVELLAVLLLTIVIVVFGFGLKEVYFFVLICLLGLFIGPNYPSIMAWADRYIEATGFVVAIIDTGIGAGAFLAALMGGILLKNQGPRSLFYLCAASAVFVTALFLPLQLISHRQGDRHQAMAEVEGQSDRHQEGAQVNGEIQADVEDPELTMENVPLLE